MSDSELAFAFMMGAMMGYEAAQQEDGDHVDEWEAFFEDGVNP